MVLLAAVLLEFTGSTVFYEQAETYSADNAHLARTAEQLATDVRLLSVTPKDHRTLLAGMLSTSDLRLEWRPDATVEPETAQMHRLHRQLGKQLLAYGRQGLMLHEPGQAGDVSGVLPIGDGSVLDFTSPGMMARHTVTRGLLSAAILAGCVLLAAAMLVHTLSLPLRALARVADAIGRGPQVPVLEYGPREVRHLARAMNAMQSRISRLIADRTEALAAVSHDLRTPLSRLRLRAGFLDDADVQGAIEADLDEMEAMVDSVLSYLAGESHPEPVRIIDLAALLATLVDEAADAGRNAHFIGPDHASARLRPLATKRVFANLLSNALAYAGNVVVTLARTPDGMRVMVEDDGPGIPDAELERVLTPFYRVEASRGRATGGLGLGLAIVQREVERDGGILTLENRSEGGLRVSILWPEGPTPG
ncbi:ATP-binding protein [Lichenicola sp.]|uniref:ATP-binding protein n=1 Tax=Lichenicola sp. TaxID=2804529 RepID=UPI003B005E16